jgi:hypothetical protein
LSEINKKTILNKSIYYYPHCLLFCQVFSHPLGINFNFGDFFHLGAFLAQAPKTGLSGAPLRSGPAFGVAKPLQSLALGQVKLFSVQRGL